MAGIKLLVAAFESSGKSTITSQLDNVLVFNFDAKQYGFPVAHANLQSFEGMPALLESITEKIEAYNTKFGNYPATVVFDTVTQLYTSIQKYNGAKYTGFDMHARINSDTLGFNTFIEETLIPSDINVVVTAHVLYDESTNRHIIPASGAFAKSGSWLSVVNDSIFVEKSGSKLKVHTSGFKYPARSTLPDLATNVPIADYSLQAHLDKLTASKFEAIEFEL